MAVNDVRIVDAGGHNCTPTWQWSTAASASLVAGDFTAATTGSENAARIANGDGTTTQMFPGLVSAASTDTASAAGVVQLYIPLPGIIYEAAATTAANVDTDAEITALVGNCVTFDLSGTTITVDEDVAHAATNAVGIVGGDSTRNTLKWILRDATSFIGHVSV